MRRLPICIALVLSLAFASDAVAKEVTSAKVCGPSECRETRDRADLTLLENGGGPTDPPAGKSPWYSVRLTMKIEGASDEHFTQVFVPRGGLLRGGDASEGYVWMALAPTYAHRYRELTRGIAPYAAAKLSGTGPPKVRVDEVVLGPQQPAESGGASPLPWIGGGVALLAAGLFLLLRRRRRGRGLRWPRPSEG
jgi:MYXO-CTERM domain-containing protein